MNVAQKEKFVAELTEILERVVRLVSDLKASGIDPEEIAESIPPELAQAMDGLFDD